MKVIQQLIAYFDERGKLSPEQTRQLMEKGYWQLHTADELRGLESRVGESFFFEATGAASGSLWGTDIYTSDSSLGVACVHAGLLKVGEAGIIKVTLVKPIPVFRGSMRHGVTSNDWTTGWPGAYRVELVRK